MKLVNIKHLDPLDYSGQEAMNSICTNLTFAGHNLKKILLTSHSPADGKSWMTMHIAINLAERGRRVLLIDADLRRSFMVQRYKLQFEVQHPPGFSLVFVSLHFYIPVFTQYCAC